MNIKILKFTSFLLFYAAQDCIQAQEAILTTGSNSSGNGGTVSYSVGQIVYTSNDGTNGSAIQGVQQPFEISVSSAIKETKYISLDCTVYPNPATDYLILKIEGELPTNFVAYLYDINGKLVRSIIVESNETRIEMSNLVPSTYFIKVSDNKQELKIFKIIKH